MGTIEEVMDDVKDVVGKKGLLVLGVGVVLIFIYNLTKGSSESETVNVTALTSYPDAVTNANVIIDTLQQSIDYSEGEIKEEIQGLDFSMKEYLDQHFEATNDYINVGIESNQDLMNKNFDEIMGGIDGVSGNVSNIQSAVDNMKAELNKKPSVQYVPVYTPSTPTTTTKPATTTTSKPATTTTTKPATSKPATTTQYYTYQTKSGLNTNTSIVDALKATGVDSSFDNRAKIYYANGGSGTYTGSYSQNVTMLNSLKSGTLKKV